MQSHLGCTSAHATHSVAAVLQLLRIPTSDVTSAASSSRSFHCTYPSAAVPRLSRKNTPVPPSPLPPILRAVYFFLSEDRYRLTRTAASMRSRGRRMLTSLAPPPTDFAAAGPVLALLGAESPPCSTVRCSVRWRRDGSRGRNEQRLPHRRRSGTFQGGPWRCCCAQSPQSLVWHLCLQQSRLLARVHAACCGEWQPWLTRRCQDNIITARVLF